MILFVSKRSDGVLLQLAPSISGRLLCIGVDCADNLKREGLIFNIFCAKARANLPKGTLSTDCKSNCMMIAKLIFLRIRCRPSAFGQGVKRISLVQVEAVFLNEMVSVDGARVMRLFARGIQQYVFGRSNSKPMSAD